MQQRLDQEPPDTSDTFPADPAGLAAATRRTVHELVDGDVVDLQISPVAKQFNGTTVDILFDVTQPGLWMAHCHIAEHMQYGMMFRFVVDRETE